MYMMEDYTTVNRNEEYSHRLLQFDFQDILLNENPKVDGVQYVTLYWKDIYNTRITSVCSYFKWKDKIHIFAKLPTGEQRGKLMRTDTEAGLL